MKKTIYLHIGTHKTATTWLQNIFINNIDVLHNNDLYYPTLAGKHHRLAALATTCSRRKSQLANEEHWVKLKNEICDCKQSNILISSENFEFNVAPGQIREYLGNDFSFKIIVYLRRQDDYIESFYQQQIRDFKPVRSESIEDYIKENNYRYLDYEKLLGLWEGAFGRESMVVRIFDPKRLLDSSIDADFFSILDKTDIIESLDYPSKKDVAQKRRMHPENLELLRYLNSAELNRHKYKHFVDSLLEIEVNQDSLRLLSLESRKRLIAKYADSNLRISQKYFSGNSLFAPPEDEPYFPQVPLEERPQELQLIVQSLKNYLSKPYPNKKSLWGMSK